MLQYLEIKRNLSFPAEWNSSCFVLSKQCFIHFVALFSSKFSFCFLNFSVCMLNQIIRFSCGMYSASYRTSNPVEIYKGETYILHFLFSTGVGDWIFLLFRSLFNSTPLFCKIIISASEIMTSWSGPLKITHEWHKPHRLYYSPIIPFFSELFLSVTLYCTRQRMK